jgi:hypothetical protein
VTLRPEDITSDRAAFTLVRETGLLDDAAAVVILPAVHLILPIVDDDGRLCAPGDDVGDAVEDAILGMSALDGAGLGWIVWATPPGDLRARSVYL